MSSRVQRAIAPIARIERACRELEEAVRELGRAVEDERGAVRLAAAGSGGSLEASALSLERLSLAIRNVVARASTAEGDRLRALWRGVQDAAARAATARIVARSVGRASEPSTGGRALALLLERAGGALSAADVAERLGCSVPIARTTLHRLVVSGHAERVGRGRFRARG